MWNSTKPADRFQKKNQKTGTSAKTGTSFSSTDLTLLSQSARARLRQKGKPLSIDRRGTSPKARIQQQYRQRLGQILASAVHFVWAAEVGPHPNEDRERVYRLLYKLLLNLELRTEQQGVKIKKKYSDQYRMYLI